MASEPNRDNGRERPFRLPTTTTLPVHLLVVFVFAAASWYAGYVLLGNTVGTMSKTIESLSREVIAPLQKRISAVEYQSHDAAKEVSDAEVATAELKGELSAQRLLIQELQLSIAIMSGARRPRSPAPHID